RRLNHAQFRNAAYIKMLDHTQIQNENAAALLPPHALSQRARAAQGRPGEQFSRKGAKPQRRLNSLRLGAFACAHS
ncbi:MAG: hypothetical protein ACHRHE_23275, partial [Tepidisphaerales bacterium]